MSPTAVLGAQELAQRLAEAEATIQALLSGQIDAVVDSKSQTPVLLAKAQDALRESEEALRRSAADLREERDRAQRYLDTAEVILLALDADGRVTLVNRFACAKLGRTAEELLGRDFIETCLPDRLRDMARQRFHDVVGGDLSIIEVPIVTRTGEERLIEWRNTVLRDDVGRVTGTFSSGTDITERNQAVEALRTAEERMRFALTSANIGIWDMDYKAGVVRWSDTLELQYGLQPGTFGGTFDAFAQVIHPEDRESVLATIGKTMESGGEFSVLHRTVRPDGTVRWLSGAGRVLLGDDGKPVRAVGISQDVTERRTLERQYQQAQKMEAVGQLASGVAHDFNNLLTVILGCAEILTSDPTMAPEHREELGEITKAARRAAGLTKQLLAFGRQQVLRTAPVDVNALITDMTSMLGRLIGEDIQVELALTPHLCPALVDRGQLEQVVMNLVVNARDAMSGGGSVTIQTAEANLDDSVLQDAEVVQGRYVMLAITDTGSGMSKETQRHLFEPFFTTKERGKGTGLGLSTTYGIVKQSKGYIWVESDIGKGTTFKVYLPCTEGDVAVEPVTPAVTPAVKRASETVLLVEDENSVRRLSKRMLERVGYRVLEAGNGDDAEKVFADNAEAIALVVTDVIMPGCGGPELLRRLKVRSPALRVLYMSGYTERSGGRSVGFDQGMPYVQKPFTAAELTRRVREALDR